MPEFIPSELLQKFLPLADDAGGLVAKGASAMQPAAPPVAPPNLQQTLVQRAMTRDAGQTIGAKDPRTHDAPISREDPFSSPEFLHSILHQIADPGNWTGVGEAAEAVPLMAGAQKLLPAAVEDSSLVKALAGRLHPSPPIAEHALPQKAMFTYPAHPKVPPPPVGSAPTPGGWDSFDEDNMWNMYSKALEGQAAIKK